LRWHRWRGVTVVRLLAAYAVLYGHAFSVRGSCEPVLGCRISMGPQDIGVCVFFAISGFLVTQSWARDAHILRFLIRRIMRLMPALMVSVVVTVGVIGPAATSLPLAAYFGSEATRAYLGWAVLAGHGFFLPGVFEHNPIAVVNASLWSLPVEAMCYMVVAAVGVVRGLNRWFYAACLALALGACWQVGGRFPHVIACFTAGGLAFTCRTWRMGAPPRTPAFGDLSYGVYLYAFPIQQVIMQVWPEGPVAGQIVAAVVVASSAACLSWRFVEQPALRLKPRQTGGFVPSGRGVVG